MRLLIVGAGSTGGYFGGRVAEAGRDVTFLVRPARAALLREKGLRIVSPNGDATIQPQLVTADTIEAPFDAVLLSVKAYSLDAAMVDMTRAVGPQTVIVPILNGMRHIETLQTRFGQDRVAGGVARIGASVDAEGRIQHLGKFADISYGELAGGTSDRMQALDAMMQGAGGFTCHLATDIQSELWDKWIMLSSVGACCCLMGGHLGEIGAVPGGHDVINGILDEVVAVITASGHPPAEATVARIRKQMTGPDTKQTTSMYRDKQAGAAVEGDQVVGDLVLRGQKLGVPTPLLKAAHATLSVYQTRITKA